VKLHRVEILSRQRFGSHALLRYRWREGAPEPGQFVMVRPRVSAQVSDPFLNKPFFAHDYGDGMMSLLFEVRGRGTALLADEDDELAVSEPLGKGFALDDGGLVLLVGGGVWVSPLKLLSRSLSRSGTPHEVYLEIPSVAPEAYRAWISENYPAATLVPTDGSKEASHIVLDSLGDLGRYSGIYASGPDPMLAALRNASVDRVPAQLVLRERMACANGSCYGCAVPVWRDGSRTYARACVEGPVFSAEALAW